jgi:hypothetical protein
VHVYISCRSSSSYKGFGSSILTIRAAGASVPNSAAFANSRQCRCARVSNLLNMLASVFFYPSTHLFSQNFLILIIQLGISRAWQPAAVQPQIADVYMEKTFPKTVHRHVAWSQTYRLYIDYIVVPHLRNLLHVLLSMSSIPSFKFVSAYGSRRPLIHYELVE